MVWALPLCNLPIGLAVGHWLGRSRQWAVFVVLMLMIVALFAWAVITPKARERTGFDGVGEAALLVPGLLPCGIGGLAGAGIAAVCNRRESDG